jgi:hypothetical protein
MSESNQPKADAESLAEISERLRELAALLRDPALDDERAVELAREAAELAASASAEADRATRASQAEDE